MALWSKSRALQAQQHSFNCPFQLAAQKRWPEADPPEAADMYEVELLPGDILVLGSDGLFDNMWDSQLESTVRDHMKVCHSFPAKQLHACWGSP